MSERPLKIVMVGHVDHGKSTLVGRLIHDTGSMPEGRVAAIQTMCDRRGVAFEWAFLMDALRTERDRNITIDASHIWFRTPSRPYVIVDAPGHREFLKNMVTGASSADAAVLVVAADQGIQEQTRRHATMLSLLGIGQVAVVVNKMDLVGYSKSTFDEIEHQFRAFLNELGVEPKIFIPAAARDGDNLVTRTAPLAWFDGPTLSEVLDGFSAPIDEPATLRLPVQDVYRWTQPPIVVGRIESGTVDVGDELVFMPGGERVRVASIQRWGRHPNLTKSGDAIGLTLDGDFAVKRGDVATLAAAPRPSLTRRVTASLFWLGQRPLTLGASYKLKLVTQEVGCVVASIARVLDTSTLKLEAARDQLDSGQAATVMLELSDVVVADPHAAFPNTGRFVLVDGFDVAGGGIVVALD